MLKNSNVDNNMIDLKMMNDIAFIVSLLVMENENKMHLKILLTKQDCETDTIVKLKPDSTSYCMSKL